MSLPPNKLWFSICHWFTIFDETLSEKPVRSRENPLVLFSALLLMTSWSLWDYRLEIAATSLSSKVKGLRKTKRNTTKEKFSEEMVNGDQRGSGLCLKRCKNFCTRHSSWKAPEEKLAVCNDSTSPQQMCVFSPSSVCRWDEFSVWIPSAPSCPR